MGSLLYGPQERAVHLDDRALAHLKIVLLQKLRRNETFAFAWTSDIDGQVTDSTLWLHPSVPLQFVFDGPEPRDINRGWLQALIANASAGEVRLLEEPT